MTVFKGKDSLALAVTVFLLVLTLGSCTTVEYSYDMRAFLSPPKSYAWAPSSETITNAKDPLLETNVQVLTDQLLVRKGFTRVSEKPDLMVSMSYQFDNGEGYGLQTLTLNVYQIERPLATPSDTPRTSATGGEKGELVWRGTAYPLIGTIDTAAPSGGLRKAVEAILSKFPRK